MLVFSIKNTHTHMYICKIFIACAYIYIIYYIFYTLFLVLTHVLVQSNT